MCLLKHEETAAPPAAGNDPCAPARGVRGRGSRRSLRSVTRVGDPPR